MSEFLNYEPNSEILSQAAGRALGSIVAKYKAHGCMGYTTYTKLFDSCVYPVMDYASGVWGFDKSPEIRKVFNRAQRIFLGVHKFAPIVALEGDMGWIIPRYRRWISMLRLWNKMVQMPEERLTKHVFVHDFYLAQSNYSNWCTKVFQILSSIEQEDTFYNREVCDIAGIQEKLLSKQNDDWRELVRPNPN